MGRGRYFLLCSLAIEPKKEKRKKKNIIKKEMDIFCMDEQGDISARFRMKDGKLGPICFSVKCFLLEDVFSWKYFYEKLAIFKSTTKNHHHRHSTHPKSAYTTAKSPYKHQIQKLNQRSTPHNPTNQPSTNHNEHENGLCGTERESWWSSVIDSRERRLDSGRRPVVAWWQWSLVVDGGIVVQLVAIARQRR